MPRLCETEDYIRAANTRRWLENGGPDYREFNFTFLSINADTVSLRDTSLKRFEFPLNALSFASECICWNARPGDDVCLKIRWDGVGLARIKAQPQ